MPGDEAGQPFPAADGPMYGLLLLESEAGWESKKEVLFFTPRKVFTFYPLGVTVGFGLMWELTALPSSADFWEQRLMKASQELIFMT